MGHPRTGTRITQCPSSGGNRFGSSRYHTLLPTRCDLYNSSDRRGSTAGLLKTSHSKSLLAYPCLNPPIDLTLSPLCTHQPEVGEHRNCQHIFVVLTSEMLGWKFTALKSCERSRLVLIPLVDCNTLGGDVLRATSNERNNIKHHIALEDQD